MPFYQRKSPLLKGFDYTTHRAYFVTICTHLREWLFGSIETDQMCLSAFGIIAHACWDEIPAHFPQIDLDSFVVMPNHIHGILVIGDTVGTGHALSSSASPKSTKPSLSSVIGSYKAAVTRKTRQVKGQEDRIVWQVRFHDHIIRDEQDLNRIREYVQHNPARWAQDVFYESESKSQG